MKPYFQDEFTTLYCCDNRDILSKLGRFDLLLTDPPYGIGADNQKQILSRGVLAKAKDYGQSNWDNEPANPHDAIQLCDKAIVWGGNYFNLPPSPAWLVWDKENGANDFADAELAWTNLEQAIRLKRHLWHGMIRKGQEKRWHPTQKPLDIMNWCLTFTPNIKTCLDPWAGVGTTGVACKLRGVHCTMVEINEAYCQTIVQRLSQGVLLPA